MLIKAQIAIDRRRRPLVAVMAFAQAAIYPDRRVARFNVEIDAARIDQALGMVDLAAQPDGELIVGHAKARIVAADGACD